MSFITPKNNAHPHPKLSIIKPKDSLIEKEIILNNNKNNSFVPFLSNTEKLKEKIEPTPGPGYYDIENKNYIHKEYIKNNSVQYKSDLNNIYNIMSYNNIKINEKQTPGPGDYNPAENINFGSKIKAKKYYNNRNAFISNNGMKNYIFFNNSESDKIGKIYMNINMDIDNKYMHNYNQNENININIDMNSKTNINFNKTKKVNFMNNKILKKLLFNYSKLNQEDNSKNFKESFCSNESSINIFNLTNNTFNKPYEKLNIHTLNKSNSTNNIKPKIIKSIHDHIRIKEISNQKKLEMKALSSKSNYYLEKYLKSKVFDQQPGPGYYFSKFANKTNYAKEEFKNKIIKKQQLHKKKKMEIVSKNVSEKHIMKKVSLSKTMYDLKNNLIKKGFEKVKEVYIKNKYQNILEKIIKMKNIKQKEENQKQNFDKNNNNKEIQSSGYPIKYNRINNKNNINNSSNFISKEKRFIGPTGWENEIMKNMNPGPGEYDQDNKSISKQNKNIISLNLVKNLIIPENRKLFTDEIKDTNPPVGSYQSQVFNSIEFNNLMKSTKNLENPLKNGFFDMIKIKTKKNVDNIKLNQEIIHSMLSPCSYFQNLHKKKKNNNNKKYKSFILEKKRGIVKNSNKDKENKEIIRKDMERYAKAEYQRWIKKSFNASFF